MQLIRPGAFVTVELKAQILKQVVRIPERALHEGPKVYVVADGRLKTRSVQIIAATGANVLVRGDLKDGDQIVLTRYAEMGSGQRAEVGQ